MGGEGPDVMSLPITDTALSGSCTVVKMKISRWKAGRLGTNTLFWYLLLASRYCGGGPQGALWATMHRYQRSWIGLGQHPRPRSGLTGRFFGRRQLGRGTAVFRRKMTVVKHFRNPPPCFSVPETKLSYRAIVLLSICILFYPV